MKKYGKIRLTNGKVSYAVWLKDGQIGLLSEPPWVNDNKIIEVIPDTGDIHLLAPCNPSKIICVGLNYRQHAAELDMQLPPEPVIFLKPPSAVIGPGDIIRYPEQSQRVDYEGELAVVIGHECKKIDTKAASRYIFGYTCANDVTARDLQQKDGQWTRAKSFDTFLPLGPYIIKDIDWRDRTIRTTLNGQIKQEAKTDMLIHSVEALVSYVSQVMTLYPGDVILTGTPEGVGPMLRGDEVSVEIEGLGILINKVE
ncbi:2-keto-4-pentenoate hydratase/2-oxohepta-3-ene-1,7-dioic acid hydratase (catechol pathway) [Carboxydocella sporoproducens DSM 16521]|uniref:2-keto-4-pentenoate hydratase/2-oxohepta-3-ene-1,7-dioic acid hydratase (Catechol pathway) n=2 Tax=Carboxydocella TaxID=178898 RepID=A0A1T4PX76_9FIRM|nr:MULTISPECIES: fumarylacetoacetate hydrolase family protein [Carboxydocella]AVX20452.1 2-keto-4-pentenoate hydratase/2-oxohepta-3-ene-1,7-dioic acid hydratase (catechol pathway) [Carboxydocella thermautotrophica]AVX30873.1 2-keto-4-pentenoate hydratase/2-oxohepta-3-ene-1,7-dioic acid hydratase (catechol pathway) [Carboxydocella thermautotrophica]SJZ95548.1 2-keto-4-pentenoate hydratase/2-oxohepta-3-ene-1,7-dioic acid hydratase (catechol pathway) [Carboxydocella sporoproducens DSM 16521]